MSFVLLARVAGADTIDDALAPLPQRSYLRLDPSYSVPAGSSELLARAVLVERGLVGVPDTVAALRIDVPFDHDGSSTGLGKIALLGLSGITWAQGSAGIGFGAALPTATSAMFGAADVQVGPAAYGSLVAIEHVPLSIVAQTLFATGGSPGIETTLEPMIAIELGHAALVSNDIIVIDWLAHDARVPLNLRLGYAFDDHWYVETGPEVIVAGSTTGDLSIDLAVDYYL